jgi:hypothetical protein
MPSGGARPGAGRPRGSYATTNRQDFPSRAAIGAHLYLLKRNMADRPPSDNELPHPDIPDDCTPLEFLTAVMRMKNVPLFLRVDCAKQAAQYKHPKPMAISVVSGEAMAITVEGGLPRLPGAETIMPGEEINGPIIDQEPEPKRKPGRPHKEPVKDPPNLDLFDDAPKEPA